MPADASPQTAWVHLTVEEAVQLLESLKAWEEDAIETGSPQPGWHTHVTDDDGNELTIAVGEGEVSETTAP
jgi:penicillin V acylase-like amidase (Ntn superfamily)